MREVVHLVRASNGVHKFTAVFPDGTKVHFGRQGYSDYTKHKDSERMKRYLVRHRTRENWTRTGVKTAGFWSRWILWSSPSLSGAIAKTEKVLRKKIVQK
jgi:hypothetical protein